MTTGSSGNDPLAALKAALRACTDREYREIVRELDAERYPRIAGGSGATPSSYYWGALGAFIERENPYLELGKGTISDDPDLILRGGVLEEFSAASGLIYKYDATTKRNPPPTTEAGWEAAVRAGNRLRSRPSLWLQTRFQGLVRGRRKPRKCRRT